MGIANILNSGWLRVVIYSILIFLSFLIFVGVAIMKDKADGHCPLYLKNKGRNRYWYSRNLPTCNYCIAIAAGFQLIFLFLRVAILILRLLDKLSKDLFLFSNVFEFFYVLIDIVVFILTVVSACLLTVGSNWEFGDRPFKWRPALEVAQVGAWISTILWFVIALIGFIALWVTGRVPCVEGNRQTPGQPKEGRQAEMEPAAEKFTI